MSYQTVNPTNGQVEKTFDEISDAQLEAAVAAAQACYDDTWRDLPIAQRAGMMAKAASILRERTDDFARLATTEMGKLLDQSRWEVRLCADIIAYYAENAERFLAPRQLPVRSGEAILESTPVGVLFGVQPWNFPYYQLVRFAAPNLMAGNVVMVKHASIVPQCALAFEQLFKDAGFPEGAYTNLFISKDQISRLIADPRVKGVALTGSEAAGASVAALAGKHLKKSTMELGGSDPFIVLDDADLNTAVKCALIGRLNNAGQSCVASKRFIVSEKLADTFLQSYTAALGTLKLGDPFDATTTLGPLSSKEALDNLLEQVERAVQHGAKVVVGGKRAGDSGAFMQPTVLTGIDRNNPAYGEEFFGPVALFFKVADEDEAVALANDTQFGLGASVYSKDEARAKKLARRIDSGMVFINQPTSTAPELPFGGVKNSGYGRELSDLGIHEFVNRKLIRSGGQDVAGG